MHFFRFSPKRQCQEKGEGDASGLNWDRTESGGYGAIVGHSVSVVQGSGQRAPQQATYTGALNVADDSLHLLTRFQGFQRTRCAQLGRLCDISDIYVGLHFTC